MLGETAVDRLILRKKQPLVSFTGQVGAGDDQADAVGELVAIGQPPRIAIVTRHGAGRLEAMDIAPATRDDVDHGEERVVAVKRRAGAADDFHAVYQVQVQEKVRVGERRVGDVHGCAAVDQRAQLLWRSRALRRHQAHDHGRRRKKR